MYIIIELRDKRFIIKCIKKKTQINLLIYKKLINKNQYVFNYLSLSEIENFYDLKFQ